MSKYVICLVGVSGLNVAGSRSSCPARKSMRYVELSRSGGYCCCGWGKRYGPILTSCDMGLSPILALKSILWACYHAGGIKVSKPDFPWLGTYLDIC